MGMELLPSSVIQGMFGLRVWHEKNWDFWITELLDSGVTWIQILQERGAENPSGNVEKSLWNVEPALPEPGSKAGGSHVWLWWDTGNPGQGDWPRWDSGQGDSDGRCGGRAGAEPRETFQLPGSAAREGWERQKGEGGKSPLATWSSHGVPQGTKAEICCESRDLKGFRVSQTLTARGGHQTAHGGH